MLLRRPAHHHHLAGDAVLRTARGVSAHIGNSRERDHAAKRQRIAHVRLAARRYPRAEAAPERQLTARGMPDYYHASEIERMLPSRLTKRVHRASDVKKRVRPAAARFMPAPVFDVPRRPAFLRQ